MSSHVEGVDPLQAIELEDYEDPNPEEVVDPTDPNYCEPAVGIKPIGGGN